MFAKTMTSKLGRLLGILIPVLGLAAPAGAGSLEVTVRERGGRPVAREHVRLDALPGTDSYRAGSWRWPSAVTDVDGRARFTGLDPGTYTVTLPTLRQRELLRPSDNPFAPPPRVTLFEEHDDLEVELELWRGIRATVYVEEPTGDGGFAAVFRHRETGRSLKSFVPGKTAYAERLLVPGVWDVTLEPRPGFLLVAVEHDRVPLPGSSVRVDLAQVPRETSLKFTYTAPAYLYGVVVEETGKRPSVRVEATLVEPGPWIDAARQRGGSIYETVTAGVDPYGGSYEMVLPDGRWRVRPVGSLLAASRPEAVDLDLAPGGADRADFTIRLDEGVGDEPLSVVVRDARHRPVPRAAVEVYAGDDPSRPLRQGTTNRRGWAVLPGLEDGAYRVVAGQAETLEGSAFLPELGAGRERPRADVVLEDGAEIRLRAFDVDERPLAGATVTVERLGDLPELTLKDPAFLEAKTRRTLETDGSGRNLRRGFYPGTYRARGRIRGEAGTRGLLHLSAGDGPLAPEVELEIDGTGTVELTARRRPAASWSASLVCADPSWALPDAADVRVFDVLTPVAGLDLDDPGPGSGQVLALQGAVLGGRHRDVLAIGPLAGGVYRLAVRPAGFDRWTWAFETTDPRDAHEIQAEPSGSGEPSDLGTFQVECAPAVDLLPVVLDGSPFPDLQDVDVGVRVLDRDDDREIAPAPIVGRRAGRFELRGLPRGPMRLELAFDHPHFLPVPTLGWQVELELERGQFREVATQVEALGGAVRIEGPGSLARLFSPDEEVREAAFRNRGVEIPSLAPGRYRLEVVDGSGTVIQGWEDLEVPAGETVRLTVSP